MASTTLSTPIGKFTIVGSGRSVLAAGFTDNPDDLIVLMHPNLRKVAGTDADFSATADAITAYFDGDLEALDTVTVEQHSGGSFLGHAWDTLRMVKPGSTTTYTDLATLAGRPAAVRAAAQACARNAAALFVPCHRIVRTDGSLGGYRWGLEVKQWLLAHEQRAAETRS